MTREEAKREIDSLDYYLQNHTGDYGEKSHTAMMMAIKALDQEPCEDCSIKYELEVNLKKWADAYKRGLEDGHKEPILDKIRAEIEPKCDRIYNLISVYPHAERREIQELLCEIMDLCDAESEENDNDKYKE